MSDPVRPPPSRASERGFSLIELLVTLGITTVVLGATMAALGDAVKMADAATLVSGLNDNLRNGVDLMVRDLQQAGQGLPSGRFIQVPSGAGAAAMRVPGPRTTNYVYTGTSFCPPPTPPATAVLCSRVNAVIPGPSRGPVIAGTATDMITVLMADSSFEQVRLTAFAANSSSVTIETVGPDNTAGTADDINITNGGPDDLDPGDLLMLTKGSVSTLAQISAVAGQQVSFAAGDSLLLNQTAPPTGTIVALRATAPAEVLSAGFTPTVVSRIRMVSYYLDVVTDPLRPRLVRRINNGRGTATAPVFDNTLGTVVAFDIDNLSITYDLADGGANPSNVRMTAADLQGGGACGVLPCSPIQIRKVNILLSGRSRVAMRGTRQFFRNRLVTEISLRSMVFGDRYR